MVSSCSTCCWEERIRVSIKEKGWNAWKSRDKERKKSWKVGKKEESLAAGEAKINEHISAADNLLKEGAMRLSKGITARIIQEIETASALIEWANAKLSATGNSIIQTLRGTRKSFELKEVNLISLNLVSVVDLKETLHMQFTGKFWSKGVGSS